LQSDQIIAGDAMKTRDTLLIVDDVEINRGILQATFNDQYKKIIEAENGEVAVAQIRKHHEHIAAVLLDLIMPVMDGYEVMEILNREGFISEFPVIIITADNTTKSELQAFDSGVTDIISKPFEPSIVQRRVQNAVELNLYRINLEEMVQDQANEIVETSVQVIDTLSAIIEYRNVETGQHNRRIRTYTKIMLDELMEHYPEYDLSKSAISLISSASVLHDIGKIAIPDSILNKPGRLTTEEFEIMKTHAVKGSEMLSKLKKIGNEDYLYYANNICKYHHERWDGKGYPDGLKGDEIPVCAQVTSIADCYDALTNDRVYKKAIPPEEALKMIFAGKCGQFSPKLMECLNNVSGTFKKIAVDYQDSDGEIK